MQLEEEREARKDLEEQFCQATNAVQQIQSETELLRLRTVADENKKWEECEARWTVRLRELEEKVEDTCRRQQSRVGTPAEPSPEPTTDPVEEAVQRVVARMTVALCPWDQS